MYVNHWDNAIREADRVAILQSLGTATGWQRSTVTHNGQGSYANDNRTSLTLFQSAMPPDVLEYLRGLNKWIGHLVGRDPRRLEGWQAISYALNQEFQAHMDPVAKAENKRDMTVLLTLQQPIDGGETYFPKLQYAVHPVERRLLVWENLQPDGSLNPHSLHAGLPVRKGHKLVLVNWFLQR